MVAQRWASWLSQHTVFRYLVSGGTGAIVHFIILTLMVEGMAADPLLATSIGFVVGSLVNYTLQYHWTFDADGPHHLMLGRYAAVTTTTVLINDGLFWTFTSQLGLHYLVAQFIASGLMVLVNYTINKNFTFVSP